MKKAKTTWFVDYDRDEWPDDQMSDTQNECLTNIICDKKFRTKRKAIKAIDSFHTKYKIQLYIWSTKRNTRARKSSKNTMKVFYSKDLHN